MKRTPFGNTSNNTNMITNQYSKPTKSLSQCVLEFKDNNKQHHRDSTDKENFQVSTSTMKCTNYSVCSSSSTTSKPVSENLTHSPTQTINHQYQHSQESSQQEEYSIQEQSQQQYQEQDQSSQQQSQQSNKQHHTKRSFCQPYPKKSMIYKCLQESIDDLVCADHSENELSLFCSTCKQLLCEECLESNDTLHMNHEIMNLHQFMDLPVLSFLGQNSMLREVVWQSSAVLSKVKEQAEGSILILREYLNSLKEWLRIQSDAILQQFESDVHGKLNGIQKQVNQIQSISSVYKNEWDDWLGAASVTSKEELEETCKVFLESSDNPREALSSSCNALGDILHAMPELDIESFKQLYLRITDSFRLSYDNLILQKSMSGEQGAEDDYNNNKQSTEQSNKSILLRELERVSREFCSVAEYGKANNFQASKIVSVGKSNEDKYLALDVNKRTCKFFSKDECLNTLERSPGDIINSCLVLEDNRYLALGTSNYLEIFSMHTGRAVSRVNMHCLAIAAMPEQKLAVSDTTNNLSIFSVTNPMKLEIIASVRIPQFFVTSLVYQIIPSTQSILHDVAEKKSFISQEILVLGSDCSFTQGKGEQKGKICILNAANLEVILNLKSECIEKGVLQTKFVKKNRRIQEKQNYIEEEKPTEKQKELPEIKEEINNMSQSQRALAAERKYNNSTTKPHTKSALAASKVIAQMSKKQENTITVKQQQLTKKKTNGQQIVESPGAGTQLGLTEKRQCQTNISENRVQVAQKCFSPSQYLLLVLNVDNNLLVFDLEKSASPINVINLQPRNIEIYDPVSMFEVFDVDKVVFCYAQNIYVASITQGQILGALCEHSDVSGTVFVEQQSEEEEEDKQGKNMDNNNNNNNNNNTTSRFPNNYEDDESQYCSSHNSQAKNSACHLQSVKGSNSTRYSNLLFLQRGIQSPRLLIAKTSPVTNTTTFEVIHK